MLAIIGATGKVGYSTSRALRARGVPVRAVVRPSTEADRLRDIGCQIAVADLQDPEALAAALSGVEALQAILPLSLQSSDPVADLHRSIDSLTVALEVARPRLILAISDYGAHVADDVGMPSIFRCFEARLAQLGGRKLILRSAEHMHNWMRVFPTALASGSLASFQDPVDMKQPAISADDLGLIAGDLLLRTEGGENVEIIHAEGPRRYSAEDVAAAFSLLTGKVIRAMPVERSRWQATMERAMPESLAELLARANDAKNRGGLVDIQPGAGDVRHGTTELIEALRPMVLQ